MASYTPVTIVNYNQSPPPDDGSQTAANKAKWSDVKTKLTDPHNTAITSIDANITAMVAALGTAADADTGTGSGNVPLVGTTSATEALAGTLELASSAEADAHTATDKAITPATLANSKLVHKSIVDLTNGAANDTAAWTFAVDAYSKQFMLLIDQASFDVNNDLYVTLGDAGGLETTGYVGAYASAVSSIANSTTEFRIANASSASSLFYGRVLFTLLDSANNTWLINSMMGRSNTVGVFDGAGVKSLSGALTQIQLFSSAAANFDNGQAVVVQL